MAVMDALTAIAGKRDRREFSSEPVTEEDINRVLAAGRMAGSAKNAQVTRMIVVTDPTDRERMAACGDFTKWIGSAPVIVVFVVPVDLGRLFDIGRMAQNVMIAAHALGLASCPVTFHHQDRVREILGVPSDHEGPMAVTLGHPSPAPSRRPSAPRIPLDQLVHRGRWRT